MSEFYGDYNDEESYDDIFDKSSDAEEFYRLIRKKDYVKLVKNHIEEYKILDNKINELNFDDYFME